MSRHELLKAWEDTHNTLQTLRDSLSFIESELFYGLRAVGATAIDDPDYTCYITQTVDYDKEKLIPLRELVALDTLLANGYEPTHTETITVPDKWNMTKVKVLAQLGSEVASIIEGAKVLREGKLVIKRKVKET